MSGVHLIKPPQSLPVTLTETVNIEILCDIVPVFSASLCTSLLAHYSLAMLFSLLFLLTYQALDHLTVFVLDIYSAGSPFPWLFPSWLLILRASTQSNFLGVFSQVILSICSLYCFHNT